jgi:AcrR family transcriptional regulator
MAERQDRRVTRTRTALLDAFGRLILRHRRRRIGVADIVAEAGVGRSTFYDHYGGADDLHMAALARPFAVLADAAAGFGDEAKLAALLDHFRENRQRVREHFMGPLHHKVTGLLADMVEERLRGEEDAFVIPARLAALQLAEAALAPIRGWVTAQAPARADALASALCGTARAMVAALKREA